MRLKLLKTGRGSKPDAFFDKFCYEYGLYTQADHDIISQKYQLELERIKLQKERQPTKYTGKTIPKVSAFLAKVTQLDINEVMKLHAPEEFIGYQEKSNGNVQVYVAHPKSDQNPPPLVKEPAEEVEEVEGEVEVSVTTKEPGETPKSVCDDCGKVFDKPQYLKGHKRFCKGGKSE